MAPMKKNRNRGRKIVVRRGVKNSGRKGYKYSGSSDGLRVDRRTKRKITGYKLDLTEARRKRKYQRMGAGRHSKLAKGGNNKSSERESDSRDSEEFRAKRYIRKALEFGVASGYLIPDEDSGRQVLRVTSGIVQFGGDSGAEGSGSEGRPNVSTEGRGRTGRGRRTTDGNRLTVKTVKNGQKNVRKRGRSRTKSPRKPVQKRRKKLNDGLVGKTKTFPNFHDGTLHPSNSRKEPKSRITKPKRTPEARNEQPSNTRRSVTKDDVSVDDEDDEPDLDNDEDPDKNSDEKNKLPVTSRPGSIVPNSDKRTNDGEKKTGDDEPSDPSGDEGTTDDEEEEEEDETLHEEECLLEENPNQVSQEPNNNTE